MLLLPLPPSLLDSAGDPHYVGGKAEGRSASEEEEEFGTESALEKRGLPFDEEAPLLNSKFVSHPE